MIHPGMNDTADVTGRSRAVADTHQAPRRGTVAKTVSAYDKEVSDHLLRPRNALRVQAAARDQARF
jgi:hypothetical protein